MPLDLTLDLASSTSAEDWVRSSRAQELERAKKLAEQQRKKYEEEEELAVVSKKVDKKGISKYSSKDLSGLQIMHGTEAFEVGDEVILTLADTDVVQRDEYGKIVGINEDTDALENVNISEYDRMQDREKKLKRLRQPLYSGYDDDEFGDGATPGFKPSLLPQYDKEEKRGAKMVIGSGSVLSLAGGAGGDQRVGAERRAFQSLRTEYKTANDFVEASTTPSQPEIKFKKTNGKKGEQEKKRKRLREKSPEREVESKNNSAEDDYDLGKILEDADEPSNTAAPSSSSATLSAGAVEVKEEKRPLLSTLNSKKRKVSFFSSQMVNNNSVVYDDEDPELAQAMARARKSAIQARRADPASMEEDEEEVKEAQKATVENDDDDEDRGARLARAISLKAATQSNNNHYSSKKVADHSVAESKDATEGDMYGDDEEINVEGRRADGKLIFNSTTEFASRLQARLTDRARLATEAAVKEMERGMASASASVSLPPVAQTAVSDEPSVSSSHNSSVQRQSKKAARSSQAGLEGVMEEDEDEEGDDVAQDDLTMDIDDEEDDDSDDEEDDDEELDDEQMAFLHRQPLVSRGMGATLDLLKSSGELKRATELAGRARDRRDEDPSDSSDFSRVKLEYRDAQGRKLTKKEAFRQLSYDFHGYGPGKKKKEKRMKVFILVVNCSI